VRLQVWRTPAHYALHAVSIFKVLPAHPLIPNPSLLPNCASNRFVIPEIQTAPVFIQALDSNINTQPIEIYSCLLFEDDTVCDGVVAVMWVLFLMSVL
jgi:hypothetical protein